MGVLFMFTALFNMGYEDFSLGAFLGFFCGGLALLIHGIKSLRAQPKR